MNHYSLSKWLLLSTALLSPFAVEAKQTCKATKIIASTPVERFSDQGDGTVIDNQTGLMWKKCSEKQDFLNDCSGKPAKYTWQGALKHAQNVNNTGGFAGHNDWRVPNIKELKSIVEDQCYKPSINRNVFPNTGSDLFWSSSPYKDNNQRAWSVYFRFGSANRNKKSEDFRLRLVRGE